jgi:glutathione peroxidase
LHKAFGDKCELLIYPSDEFGGQELPADQIPAFVRKAGLPVSTTGFRLCAKVSVNGPQADPVWNLAKAAFPGDITWNFGGVFLFDKAGACVARKSCCGSLEQEIRALL